MGEGFGWLRGSSASLPWETNTEGNVTGHNQTSRSQRCAIYGPLSRIAEMTYPRKVGILPAWGPGASLPDHIPSSRTPIQPLGAQASSLHWGIQNFLQARCLRSQVNQDPVPPMTVAYSTDRPLHDGENGSRLWLWANNYPFSRSTRTCR